MPPAARRIAVVLTLALILSSASAHAQAGAENGAENGVVAATPHFAFYSDFDSNLHDALLEAGRDKNFQRPRLFEEGAEVECFQGLPPSARSAWDHAVDYYAEIISSERWDQKQQFGIRMDLIGAEEPNENRDMRFVGIARGFREAATPAYEACRWATQDAKNRSWIAEVVALLDVHESAVAAKLAELYGTPLAGLPIRADVMETVSWSGATTILLDSAGGHIQVSTPDHGAVALELMFHEATHTLMSPRHPIRKALAAAAEEVEVPLPRDLWHAVQFYTTGDAVRRVLEQAGEPGYVPMLFDQGIFGEYHAVMKRAWTPYLDGERTLEEAAADLLRAVGEDGPENP